MLTINNCCVKIKLIGGKNMREKLIQFFLLSCNNRAEAERELDRSIEAVQKKTGFNAGLSLQILAEEMGL